MDANYIASIINSTIRQASPVLLAALGSAICSKVGIFNIALEAQMLIGSFTGIVVNYFTGSPIIAALAAILSGTFVGYIVAVLQVKFKAADMVVGTSMILLVGGLSSILLPVFFGVKGSFTSPDLVPFTKISLPIIKDIPFLSRILENLTIVDYLSYVLAIAMFVYLYKTVSGFRMLSVGINKEAATSLGIPVTRRGSGNRCCSTKYHSKSANHGYTIRCNDYSPCYIWKKEYVELVF